MTGKEMTSIAVTAVVGFFFGIYIYLFGFLDVFEPKLSEQVTANDFSIVSEVYGGCRSACPSFQLLSDGSYRYLFTPAIDEEQVVRDGNIPRALQRDIERFVTPTAVAEQAEEIQPAVCNSYTDGIDVRYRITFNNETFTLDSCGTAIDPASSLWETLVRIWTYFETGEVS